MSDGKWLNYIGEICKAKKEGGTNYISIKKDFSALQGNAIKVVPLETYLRGKKPAMSEEEIQERLEKIDWVTHVLHLPPQEEKDLKKFDRNDKGGWINDVIELRSRTVDRNGDPIPKEKQLYFYIKRDFSVESGQIITLKKFEDSLEQLRKIGKLEDDQFEKRMEASSWLHYIGSVSPKKD